MNTLLYDIPEVWKMLFLVLIPVPVILMTRLVYQSRGRTAAWWVAAVYAVYFAYVLAGAGQGWFAENTFPPRIVLFGTVPFALFLFLVVWPSKWWQGILASVSLSSLIRVHIFRLLGGFFLVLTFLGTLPTFFGLIAGVGDVLTAITSLWVAGRALNRRAASQRTVMIWNTFGAVDILFTAIAANVLTKIAVDTEGAGVAVLGQFPFALIPAFAPPTILFLHLSIYRKMRDQFPTSSEPPTNEQSSDTTENTAP